MNKTHKEFVDEVIEKTKPLSVPEESDECMREGYEHDPKVRGPRSRPEYDRRIRESLGTETDTDKAIAYTDKVMRDAGIEKLTKEQKARLDANCEGVENE